MWHSGEELWGRWPSYPAAVNTVRGADLPPQGAALYRAVRISQGELRS